jgi:3-phosphoshikimate 1-carboxyvinyltransferase
MIIKPAKKIRGTIQVPSDKSITHRIFILSSLSKGISSAKNLLYSEDTFRTYEIMKKLGISYEGDFNNIKIIPPKKFNKNGNYYSGNSGTTARLIMGLLSSIKDGEYIVTGDKSLSKRPMKRIVEPLKIMNADIEFLENENYLPIKIIGNTLNSIEYELPVQSAQVKSAIIIAGVNSKKEVTIKNDNNTRDHTERLLKYMNADIQGDSSFIKVNPSILSPLKKIFVPGDFSSASYFITLASLHKNAKIKIENVGLNEKRIAFLNLLKEMNVNIHIEIKETFPEPYGDIYVESSELKVSEIDINSIPSMIDELPLIALLGCYTKGETILKNAEELRLKESDRIKAVVENFRALNVEINEFKDGFSLKGKQKILGGEVDSFNDHRIAMMFSIAGLLSKDGIKIKNSECVSISYPNFFNELKMFY